MLTLESFAARCEEPGSCYFIAQHGDTAIGFMKVHTEGQRYLSRIQACGISFLRFVIKMLRREGIQHLGADLEIMNPLARCLDDVHT
jgi:hypothetical protein